MFEITAVEKHFEELHNMTENISVSYSLGFKEGGLPTVGIRRWNKDERNGDSIICGNIVYLVAGDAIDKTGRIIESVTELHDTPIEEIRVNLRAQATIMGHIVTVHLGTRSVWMKEIVSDERGVLHLNKEN